MRAGSRSRPTTQSLRREITAAVHDRRTRSLDRCLAGRPDRRPSRRARPRSRARRIHSAATRRFPVDRSGDDGSARTRRAVERPPGRGGITASRLLTQDRLGSGVNEPALFWWRADYAEALLALGRLDEAAALVDAWEADAARLGREAVVAHATRCRGLVAAARGEIEVALAELARAVEQHEAVGDPFGRARALLALGIVRRRADRNAPPARRSRPRSTASRQCGAPGWAEKARAELGTIGGRTRIEGLTPAEDRIAALVAVGADEPGGRCRALSHGADGGDDAHARLPEARCALATELASRLAEAQTRAAKT